MRSFGILHDFIDYIAALWREWKLLLTGGSIASMLAIWGLGISSQLPPNAGMIVLAVTLLGAGFMSWRRERETIAVRDTEIRDLTAKITAVEQLSPYEAEKQGRVRDLVIGATQAELEFLEFLVNHGPVPYETVYEVHSRPVADGAARKWMHSLISIKSDLSAGKHDWSICPPLKEPLSRVLHESRKRKGWNPSTR